MVAAWRDFLLGILNFNAYSWKKEHITWTFPSDLMK
jgi:hypothetical protein